MKKILYAKPSITDLEISYVNDAIRNGWGDNCYDYINRFQSSFKDYLGSNLALATSSCTGAIHLALAALGVGPGDEVIVPEISWIASISPILYLGAKPIFVDVLEDTWCIDPDKIRASITSKTKAILVVHLYGNVVEMEKILAIADEFDLPVIEDAAEAIGSEYKNKKVGSIGDFGVFSFHGTKTMTTGEGGMLVSTRDDLTENILSLADHGRNQKCKKLFWMENLGYKYKMSNLQAALGCAQVERLNDLVDTKRKIFKWYKEALSGMNNIRLNPEPNYVKNSFWMPTIMFDKNARIDRDRLIEQLIKKNIQVRPFFYPLSSLPMFKKQPGNKISYNLYNRGLNLPSSLHLTKNDTSYVIESLKEYLD